MQDVCNNSIPLYCCPSSRSASLHSLYASIRGPVTSKTTWRTERPGWLSPANSNEMSFESYFGIWNEAMSLSISFSNHCIEGGSDRGTEIASLTATSPRSSWLFSFSKPANLRSLMQFLCVVLLRHQLTMIIKQIIRIWNFGFCALDWMLRCRGHRVCHGYASVRGYYVGSWSVAEKLRASLQGWTAGSWILRPSERCLSPEIGDATDVAKHYPKVW